ncbi:MAG: hypothetical protein COA45_06665 [Zetaproteobacteria bacterium]|nr:MAG: hypothetical protein COA45_06665 [Zetaproteobacteria bacterium]
MASFDFIDASARGYSFVWQERGYLARVAVPVLFVKIACLLAVFVLGLQEQYARQGLVLLPAYIVEAVFVVGLIRYALYREAIFIWGKMVLVPPSDKEYEPYQGRLSRKQCVQGGIVMYILLMVVVLGITAVVQDNANLMAANVPSETMSSSVSAMQEEGRGLSSFINAAVIFAMLAAFTWLFRLLWLYIPIVMGCSPRVFLHRISGMQSSVFMIATSLLCLLPLMVFFMMGAQMFAGAFAEGSAGDILFQVILQSVMALIITCVQVVAMTYGFVEILSNKNSGE